MAFPSIADLNLCAAVIAGREAAILHAASLAARPEHYPANIRQRLLVAACIAQEDYMGALYLRCSYLQHVLDAVLDKVDFIVCPTVGVRAVCVENLAELNTVSELTREYLSLNRPFSLLGLPSLSVPVGRDQNGIPIGLQIVGRPTLSLASRIVVLGAPRT
jgi:aspartyl-tRNA(Asn)/glutamyl-tRNA(Gln) amidotransferase subunit A